jgi:cellulose synthase/poly-beta-1,6-N-acetylglucosamine synthase-like glycosyltransferase
MISEHIVFWAATALLFYTYVGYPALLVAWARLTARPPRRGLGRPSLSVLVVAYNEGARLERRLKNLLSMDYPRDRLEIVVASDGSTDDTIQKARAFERAGVTVITFGVRRGKTAVLNDVIPQLRGDIVVLADARQWFDHGALRVLASHFADPQVGAVSGELILTDAPEGNTVGEGVGFYWRYEKLIRRNESRVDSVVGATGAIYAIRRTLFERIPEETILDDVLIPMRICRRGYRLLFAPDARAYDRTASSASAEFARKVRTIAGNFQLFVREPWLLNPFANRLWFQTVSHKLLRLLGPVGLATALVANLLLLDELLYQWLFAAQVGFYAAAAAGYAKQDAPTKSILTSVPLAFCLLNWAAVVGFVQYARGRQQVTWRKAAIYEPPTARMVRRRRPGNRAATGGTPRTT